MKNLPWLAALTVAFGAGYFTHLGVSQYFMEPTTLNNKNELALSEHKNIDANKSMRTETILPSQSTYNSHPQSKAFQSSATNTINNLSRVNQDAEQSSSIEKVVSAKTMSKSYPNEMTDEEIDAAIPAPFNNSLKRTHGPLRVKYKDFIGASQPANWDMMMQNKISDALFSNPYAKFIQLESLQCKANLCEIRLYESKNGVWSFILSEMRLQDWWEFGGTHSSGSSDTEGKHIYFVLLARKEPYQ